MAARQQNFGLVPEVTTSVVPSPQNLVLDVPASQPFMEQHHNLRPLRHRLGDSSLRDGVLTNENSPRFLCQNIAQPTQQAYGGVGTVDPSGCYQYEDFAGILGERIASGSMSDVSASTSEKVYSGYSSSGEHHGTRVKLMCSFGGKILPRPGDGTLRYAGGDTRIISVYGHTKYSDLMQKMARLYGQPVVLKYQLPNEDLDALISISCDEDVENMMDEYDRLQAIEGSNRLRIFLFSPADFELVHATSPVDIRNTDQIYMDAINGMPDSRPMSMVPLSNSSILTGQVPDTLGASRVPNNMTYVVPVVPNPQLAPSFMQPVLIQSSKQLMSRVLSASTSTPPSPTTAAQLSALRQAGLPDVSHLYSDQLLKGPVAHFHELQRADALYQDVEGVGSGTSSFNSQHDGAYRQFDAMRSTDSPPKSQHEVIVGHPHCRDQMLVADSMLPKMSSASVVPQVDSYGRLSRVGSNRSLLALQQQQPEILGPIVDKLTDCHLSDQVPTPLDIQNPALQDPGYLPQAAWHYNRETRREDSQRLDQVRLAASDSMQPLPMLSHQLHAPQILSPVVVSSVEVATYNQLNQYSGTVSTIPQQKPLTVQTSVHSPPNVLHPGAGYATASALHPGSAPSSPRVKFQDMNFNPTGIHPGLVGRWGLAGGVEQQPQIEPVLRGLKPLNVRVDPREVGDEQAGRQQLSSPLSKPQDIRSGFRQLEGDNVHSFYSEGLIEPKTPPYPGGSPYHREHLSQLGDHRLSRKNEQVQEQVHYGGGFAAYTHNQEGIDWTMGRPESEKATMRWTGLGQENLRGEASSSFANFEVPESGPAYNMLGSSFANPLSIDAATFESCGFSTTSFTPSAVAGPQPIFDRVRVSSSSTLFPTFNETPDKDPDLLGAVSENHLLRAAPIPAPCMSPKRANPNSLFVADLEEGQWVKGIRDNAKLSEDSRRLENSSNDSLYFGGGLSRQTSDKDMCSQDQQNRLSVIESGYLKGNRNRSNDAFIANIQSNSNDSLHSNLQLRPSHGNHNSGAAINSHASPLSPRNSVDSSALDSPSLSIKVEPLTHSSCLAEVIKDYECGNFASCIQVEEQEFLRSDHDRLTYAQDASLVSSPRFSKAVEAKADLPIFDSGSVEEDEIRHTQSSKASANADISLLPTSLYSVPTLSMQNWEENLSTVKLEDLVTEKRSLSIETPDNVESVVKRETLEVKVEGVLNNLEGMNVSLNPAVVAEAEAVSRGLQTIKNADLEELREVGTGTFGTVFHGKWRGTDVAIKRIKSSCFSGRPSERDRLIADFWKEAYILGQLHHPNVVAFYGVVPDGPGGTLATVTEYMVNGSLKQVLQRKDRTIDRRKRLLIIMDAAFGMEYLHGKNIVHFDLKCENLLVNMKDPQRPICKVGDLGLSKVKHQTMVSGGVRGTLPWMAPELLNGSSSLVSDKVDVFSFGIVMWELLTNEEPYANMHYGAIIGGIVNNTLRPPVPSWCDPAWKSLMEKCWAADPGDRPTFLEISAELRAMATSRPQGQTSGAVTGDSKK
ncbi:hypothetical protein GOP47_0018586 [Adiantum capillus-veneris]|uniref:Protein kinase domain-containing protein n=1 Tax=Adiantum capillus-veneris TaxID=13818 RepID=A0A9D4Z9S6_ADICA|nr:hypothetical protein GOP47_0018586 [Adiantum capillus-veneris]